MCFFNSAEYAYIEENEPISTLKSLSCRMYSFRKLTQFLHKNYVLDVPASKENVSLWRVTCVSSSEWNTHIWKK
jgi:hypothetical protein